MPIDDKLLDKLGVYFVYHDVYARYGITFESSLHKGGRNYVLFDGSAAKCTSVSIHEITKIDIDRK